MDIKQFIGCGDQWIEKRAKIIIEMQELKDCGDITQEEFEELLRDVERTDYVKEGASDIELAAKFMAAVSLLMKVV